MSVVYKDLKVALNESLETIEKKLSNLNAGDNYKLRPVAGLKTKGALGIEVAVIQLIGTWIGKTENSVCHTYHDSAPESFDELCSTIYGIAALSMADNVWSMTKERLSRSTVLSGAVASIGSLRAEEFSKSFKSRYVGIPCIRKPTYDKEFFMPIYNGDDVVDADAFYNIMKNALSDTIGDNSRYERFDNNVGLVEISNMLWELFKNTHDHGRHDEKGNELSSNFRSLIIQQQDVTDGYLDNWCGNKPTNAQNIFRANLDNKDGNNHILDISVIDFGKGFVELAKKKSGLNSEKEIFLKCLENGWSRLSKGNRGVGLTKVLKKVNEHKGWVRIRSGNLLLEKAFSAEGDREVTVNDITEMNSYVVGTSFHVSIPLNSSIKLGET
jgi:hypothetical protein